ncbi:FAD-dependent oxidoreductase [Dactylosporangium aurantiacum]|uniref:FAD-dependent oxidoreductase n=1 Tax=Dactylosporangium aurantiacum TaxID=35754 RepID=A0A9Q9IVY5_9ACTN|nr:FAD-dependent oxidoreductase [Dactylosporangium aurantiacum]MDG6103477.1 FAD-dependent oxidoreductase [Dactylosporangium aurantiacum]UWZ59923.1 FAD-dependent oxidoreductase [Dactylosporangium aurantiacum]
MVVVGAGVAGLACAGALRDAGVPVRLLERAAAPGGRLGGDVLDGRPVDLGAAYFTVTDPGFGAVVARWQDEGLARPWSGPDFAVYGHRPHPAGAAVPQRWSAPGGLASLAVDLAAGLDVTCGVAVKDLTVLDGTVVLAMPAPQAAALLPAAAPLAEAQDWQPSLAVALRYRRRCWAPLTGAFVNDHPVLTTVCDDGSRRGDGAPVLVAHTTPGFAMESAVADVEAAVRELLDLPDAAVAVTARRWPAARPAQPAASAFAQVEGVYLAGDGYGRPRVEAAWLSGRAAAAAIVGNQNPKTPRTASRAR